MFGNDFDRARPQRRRAGVIGLFAALGTGLAGFYERIFSWELIGGIFGFIFRVGWESVVWCAKAIFQFLIALLLFAFSGFGHFDMSLPAFASFEQITLSMPDEDKKDLEAELAKSKIPYTPQNPVMWPYEGQTIKSGNAYWLQFIESEVNGQYVTRDAKPLKERCISVHAAKAETRNGNFITPHPYVFGKTWLKWPEVVRSCKIIDNPYRADPFKRPPAEPSKGPSNYDPFLNTNVSPGQNLGAH